MFRQNICKSCWWIALQRHTVNRAVKQAPLLNSLPVSSSECCNYSTPSRKPNFFSQLIDNIKQEMEKNKEMKENLKKFREERQKLEESDALQKARCAKQKIEYFYAFVTVKMST
ncbi:hypothetical protein LSTR_LSTR005761 [Laodelphax striatellus]|uniref:Uncharacterized protein n=1 Tax=Laodelphax striatellus TaxID=195883 RepID=A0A482X092_LAOST|nr:hypothetical protein LSTR_LSTR005761 [Laodelphax striatellus]